MDSFHFMIEELFAKHGLELYLAKRELIQRKFLEHMENHLPGWQVHQLIYTSGQARITNVTSPEGVTYDLDELKSVKGLPQAVKRAIRKFQKRFRNLLWSV